MPLVFFIFLIFFLPFLTFGQEGHLMTTVDEQSSFPAYIEVAGGVSMASYLDKATSPLYYRGAAISGSLRRLRVNTQKETTLGLSFATGELGAKVGERPVGSSDFYSLSFEYSRLHQVKVFKEDNWNVKFGGTALATANIRYNPSLQNNSFGYEGFFNLLGSTKITRDVSRTREKKLRFWFVKFTLSPRKRSLSFGVDVGLWNNDLRNGYAYIDQYGVVNDDRAFGGYELSIFSGTRFRTALAYTVHLKRARNNAMRIAYVWDALQTAPGANRFAMAQHAICFSLLYNTK